MYTENNMSPDLWSLYGLMLRSRLFEEAIARFWHDGLISGEMHLGTGEEAINAGIISQLSEGDAMALDHRGTGPLIMRGIEPVLILRELLGQPGGLCRGMGGHMHLFSKEYLAASSGIVGAEGPAALGFAIAAQYLRPGTIAVAFFGDAAINQGMLMESMNLAEVWHLPVLFVCKDDGWGITTSSERMTGGGLKARALGLGLPAFEVDGCNLSEVWQVSRSAIEYTRSGQGPSFLHARCVHLEGHFLGYQMIRLVRDPIKELPRIAGPLTRSFVQPRGAPMGERLAGLKMVLAAVIATLRDPRRDPMNDPLKRTHGILHSDPARLQELEDQVEQEVFNVLSSVSAEVS
jgi:pyruvate dehydrogenase E1 component alpha subunit